MRAPLAVATLSASLLLSAFTISAQETPPATSEKAAKSEKSAEAEEVSPVWAWANFFILAGALGYLVAKKGGPWFASRSLAIRKGIADADQIRTDAEARAAAVDRRLAGLQSEIEALRDHARGEQAAEAERLRQQNAADLARIQAHAEREIDSAGKTARMELKRYAAQLAVDLAEQKIRRQMTPTLQSALVENFVHDLDRPSAGSHRNK
jgi:F-type H+-transporting ATPase subunit b